MQSTDKTQSSSGLLGIRFPAFPEISRLTKIMLGVVSMTASFYVVVRNTDGRSFSIEALTTSQKVVAGAFYALSLLFMTAGLCQRSKLDKVEGSKSLYTASEIPFEDQLPPWLMKTIRDSKLPYLFKSLDVKDPSDTFNDIPGSIIFFEGTKHHGIHLRFQATHTDSEVLGKSSPKVVSGIIWKEKKNNSLWSFYKSDEFRQVENNRSLDTIWNPESSDAPAQPMGVSDLDSFEALDAKLRGETSRLDWMLSRLLAKQKCRIQDHSYNGKVKYFWSLSLA